MNLYRYKIHVDIDSVNNVRGYVIHKDVFENVRETSRYYISEEHCNVKVPKENVGIGHLGVAYLLEDNFEQAKELLAFYVRSQIERQDQIIQEAMLRKNDFLEKLSCIESMQMETEEELEI